MVKTIGNPLSWSVDAIGATGRYVGEAAAHVGGDREHAPPKVQKIELQDISIALRKGVQDFVALRTDVMFIVIMYPLIGALMALAAFNSSFAPYLFPFASGFALLGPLAAIALYEMSRRREMGRPSTWAHGLHVIRSPRIGPIVVLGMYLVVIFTAWMIAAHVILRETVGPVSGMGLMAFMEMVFSTEAGAGLILIGVPVGALFAALVLVVGNVAFPLLLDRNVGVPQAVATSIKVARKNPVTIGAWGFVIAVLLVLGSLPMFLGLIVVMPVLGHASWHLYRRAVH
ncbi:hypothetical protein ATO10_07001 [Actibacterium atlanticum]|uniref:Cytochrome c oxidase subunit I n=1 Tax=Actibacterium atlanticum TaxID=1461693 RepID=A0A058ZPC9_9RHOB|nr:DUF2189 domain-containing protein [Actibacterium atlanticum]KCV82671.1 hypothetical protein ATO10_07001 [Actibacterium atlanticum]